MMAISSPRSGNLTLPAEQLPAIWAYYEQIVQHFQANGCSPPPPPDGYPAQAWSSNHLQLVNGQYIPVDPQLIIQSSPPPSTNQPCAVLPATKLSAELLATPQPKTTNTTSSTSQSSPNMKQGYFSDGSSVTAEPESPRSSKLSSHNSDTMAHENEDPDQPESPIASSSHGDLRRVDNHNHLLRPPLDPADIPDYPALELSILEQGTHRAPRAYKRTVAILDNLSDNQIDDPFFEIPADQPRDSLRRPLFYTERHNRWTWKLWGDLTPAVKLVYRMGCPPPGNRAEVIDRRSKVSETIAKRLGVSLDHPYKHYMSNSLWCDVLQPAQKVVHQRMSAEYGWGKQLCLDVIASIANDNYHNTLQHKRKKKNKIAEHMALNQQAEKANIEKQQALQQQRAPLMPFSTPQASKRSKNLAPGSLTSNMKVDQRSLLASLGSAPAHTNLGQANIASSSPIPHTPSQRRKYPSTASRYKEGEVDAISHMVPNSHTLSGDSTGFSAPGSAIGIKKQKTTHQYEVKDFSQYTPSRSSNDLNNASISTSSRQASSAISTPLSAQRVNLIINPITSTEAQITPKAPSVSEEVNIHLKVDEELNLVGVDSSFFVLKDGGQKLSVSYSITYADFVERMHSYLDLPVDSDMMWFKLASFKEWKPIGYVDEWAGLLDTARAGEGPILIKASSNVDFPESETEEVPLPIPSKATEPPISSSQAPIGDKYLGKISRAPQGAAPTIVKSGTSIGLNGAIPARRGPGRPPKDKSKKSSALAPESATAPKATPAPKARAARNSKPKEVKTPTPSSAAGRRSSRISRTPKNIKDNQNAIAAASASQEHLKGQSQLQRKRHEQTIKDRPEV